jgi:hypothetical protein
MCEACESDEPFEPFEPREPVRPEILAAARAIEAALAGQRVPDQAWAIYLGRAGGAVPWPQYRRIRASFEAAYASTPPVLMEASLRRRRAAIRCEGVA